MNVGQGYTGGIRRIARWGLSETQEANDHKGNLVLLGVAVTDHCGLDLSGRVRVDGNLDAAKGGEEHPTTLGEDEINRMVDEAESHAEEDTKRKEEAEARNTADNLVYTTEKTLKEVGEKIGEDDRSNIETSLNDAKEALKGDDVEKIKSTTETLSQAAHKLAEVVYEQAQEAQTSAEQTAGEGEGAAEGAEQEGEVIDAEVVDEEEAQ